MRVRFVVMFILSTLFLYGCSTVGNALNPYEGDFSCPETEKGKCVSVEQAYIESINNSDNSKENRSNDLKELIVEEKKKTAVFNAYENAMFEKMISLLKEPVTPIVAPPTVMRVLFLSYKGDGNELFMPRYVFFFVDEPRFILGDYISGKETE